MHFEELYALGAIDGEVGDHVVSMVSKDILKNNLVGRLLRDGQLETAAAHSRGESDPRQKPMSTTSPGDVTWF